MVLQCLDATFQYGYEYAGSSPRELITPYTERVFVSLTQAVLTHQAGLLAGDPVSTPTVCTLLCHRGLI